MKDDTLKYYGEPNNLEPRPATEAIGFGTMSTSVVSIYADDLVVEYLKQ